MTGTAVLANVENQQQVARSPEPTSPANASIITDEGIKNYLVSLVTKDVEEGIRAREARRARTWNYLLVAVGLVGFTGIQGAIRCGIDEKHQEYAKTQEEQMSARVGALEAALTARFDQQQAETEASSNTAIREAVEDVKADIQNQSVLAELLYSSFKLDVGDGFTNIERDRVLSTLRKIDDSIKSRPDFVAAIGGITDALHQADQHQSYLEAIELFPDVTVSDPKMRQTLIQHFGLRVIGNAKHPSDVAAKEIDWLERAIRVNETDHPGLSMSHALLLEFKRAGESRSQVGTRLASGLGVLDLREVAVALHVFELASDLSKLMRAPTPEGIEYVRVGQALRAVYANELEQLAAQLELARQLGMGPGPLFESEL